MNPSSETERTTDAVFASLKLAWSTWIPWRRWRTGLSPGRNGGRGASGWSLRRERQRGLARRKAACAPIRVPNGGSRKRRGKTERFHWSIRHDVRARERFRLAVCTMYVPLYLSRKISRQGREKKHLEIPASVCVPKGTAKEERKGGDR